MAIDEGTLTKGQLRKLTALKKSVGDDLGEEVFAKCLARQAATAAPKVDPVAEKIEQALAEFADDRKFNLGVYGYTIRRARGKGSTGFVATKKSETMTTLPVGQRFNLTGWQGGTSGFRIDLESRSRVFEPLQNTLRHVQVVLPGRETPTHCRITPTFWTTCPEFRSDEIGRWMVRRGEKPWEKRRPPRYEAELVVVDEGTTGICIVQDVGSNRKSRLTGP